jgi:hypothetical protein
MKIDSITIKLGTGSSITQAIDVAMSMAYMYGCVILFKFGKVNMAVTKHDDKQELMKYYNYRFEEIK